MPVSGHFTEDLLRVNHKALPLFDFEGEPFRLADELRSMSGGQIREWPTVVHHDLQSCPGRLVAVKRDRWSARLERRALRKRAKMKQKKLSRTAVFLAGYFFVWTNVPTGTLDAEAVLAWYRCRWQIETVHADCTSSECWVGLNRNPYPSLCRAAETGRVVPTTREFNHRRNRMSDRTSVPPAPPDHCAVGRTSTAVDTTDRRTAAATATPARSTPGSSPASATHAGGPS